MSPDALGATLAGLLSLPQETRLLAYLALRPGKTLTLEALAKIVDLRQEWILAAFKAWAEAGLPLRASQESWSWDDFGPLAGAAAPQLKAAVADHKAKFEIQEVLVFLESETATRRPRG